MSQYTKEMALAILVAAEISEQQLAQMWACSQRLIRQWLSNPVRPVYVDCALRAIELATTTKLAKTAVNPIPPLTSSQAIKCMEQRGHTYTTLADVLGCSHVWLEKALMRPTRPAVVDCALLGLDGDVDQHLVPPLTTRQVKCIVNQAGLSTAQLAETLGIGKPRLRLLLSQTARPAYFDCALIGLSAKQRVGAP